MTVSSTTLRSICTTDDLQDLRSAMEDHHVQVGANARTVWFFQNNWDHVIAKVKYNGGDLKLSIRDHREFRHVFQGNFNEAIKELAESLFERLR